MLRITPIMGGAANYFGNGNADYQIKGQEAPAYWHGLVASKLGLSGEVKAEDLRRLMANLSPSGERLTARMNNRENQKRREAYDFTFSVPKSVTLLSAIAGDFRIAEALRKSVDITMHEIQQEAAVRVRKGGLSHDRTTGQMIWADFLHTTTRPLNGYPDPHLHVHAVAANVTWDAREGKFKALQIGDIKKHGDYYQAFFRQTLAEQLIGMGYQLDTTAKDFEIRGVPPRACYELSRRTRQIEELNQKLAAQRGFDSLSPETKAKLGATSREKKTQGLSAEDLRQIWSQQLDAKDVTQIFKTFHDSFRHKVEFESKPSKVYDVLDRQPAIFTHERKLLAAAIYHQLGEASVATHRHTITRLAGGRQIYRNHKDENYLATDRTMAKEMKLLDLWKKKPFAGRKLITVKPPKMHRNVFQKIIASRDRVGSFRALIGTRASEQINIIGDTLGNVTVLEQPTLDEALAFAEQYPERDVVLFDTPRKGEVRQSVSDMAEDLLGVESATLSDREAAPVRYTVSQRLKDTVTNFIRRGYERSERLSARTQERATERGA